ncbi:hypothetical protein H4R24_000266 [Coemansia sp. RSA 988]|nr:hypothetical protein H4R24_000266 [Coemansia sp. RSA 988]
MALTKTFLSTAVPRLSLVASSFYSSPFKVKYAQQIRSMSRQVISTNNAPAALGPYSQAIVSDGLVFVSGQIPINPASGQIESQDIVGQTEQVLKNLEAILVASGSSIANVVKTTCFLDDINEWPAMNEVYGKVFHTAPPARSAFEVGKLPKNAKVEIEAIAKLNNSSSA